MFIAHLPAGYLLTRLMVGSPLAPHRQGHRSILRPSLGLLFVGMLASVLPDIDLLYFYLIDNRKVHHHLYWTHVPLFWLLTGVAGLLILGWFNVQRFSHYVWVFSVNIQVHFLLDTVGGGIAWAYPFNMVLYQFVEVPAVYTWWVANYLWHWTFLLELVIVYMAMLVYAREGYGTSRVRP